MRVLLDGNFLSSSSQVLMNGRNIFMGYLGMEERTLETLDAQGWVRSGDVGRRDSGGFIYITGRIKGVCFPLLSPDSEAKFSALIPVF